MPKRQGEPQPAVSFFADSVRRAMAQQLPVGELFACAAKLKLLQQKQQIVELYKAWIAHNPNDPLLYAVYFNYGVSLNENDDRFGAVNALRECIRLKSDFYPPYINLGRVLEDMGQTGPAVEQWLNLVNGLPTVNGASVAHKIGALRQIGRVLETSFKDAAAEDALKQCLELNADQDEVVQHWLALRQRQFL